jgi:hypothetical protein
MVEFNPFFPIARGLATLAPARNGRLWVTAKRRQARPAARSSKRPSGGVTRSTGDGSWEGGHGRDGETGAAGGGPAY